MKLFCFLLSMWTIQVFAQEPENPKMEFKDDDIITPSEKKEPKGRPDGKDEPSNPYNSNPKNSNSTENNTQPVTRNQEVFDVTKNYITKYSSISAEVYQNQITNNQLVLSSLRKNIVTVGAKGLLVLNIAEAVKDWKEEGKWGTSVCLVIGIAPFPYGTAGSLLCTNTLTVIRLVNEFPKK